MNDEEEPKAEREEHAQAPPQDRRFAIKTRDGVRLAHGSYDSLRTLLPVIREELDDGTRIVRLAYRRRRG